MSDVNNGNAAKPAAAPNQPQDPKLNNQQAQSGIPGGQPNGQSSADAVKAAAQEAKRRLKIDDQEVDEDEVIKIYKDRKGHQQAANKILQEGKAARKQAEEFISMMKDKGSLMDAIKKLGHDPRRLAEEYLAESVVCSNLS